MEEKEALMLWVNSFDLNCTLKDLTDGICISKIVDSMIGRSIENPPKNDEVSEEQNWCSILHRLSSFYFNSFNFGESLQNTREIFEYKISVQKIVQNNDVDEVVKVLQLLVAASVKCCDCERFVSKISKLPEPCQERLTKSIEQVNGTFGGKHSKVNRLSFKELDVESLTSIGEETSEEKLLHTIETLRLQKESLEDKVKLSKQKKKIAVDEKKEMRGLLESMEKDAEKIIKANRELHTTLQEEREQYRIDIINLKSCDVYNPYQGLNTDLQNALRSKEMTIANLKRQVGELSQDVSAIRALTDENCKLKNAAKRVEELEFKVQMYEHRMECTEYLKKQINQLEEVNSHCLKEKAELEAVHSIVIPELKQKIKHYKQQLVESLTKDASNISSATEQTQKMIELEAELAISKTEIQKLQGQVKTVEQEREVQYKLLQSLKERKFDPLPNSDATSLQLKERVFQLEAEKEMMLKSSIGSSNSLRDNLNEQLEIQQAVVAKLQEERVLLTEKMDMLLKELASVKDQHDQTQQKLVKANQENEQLIIKLECYKKEMTQNFKELEDKHVNNVRELEEKHSNIVKQLKAESSLLSQNLKNSSNELSEMRSSNNEFKAEVDNLRRRLQLSLENNETLSQKISNVNQELFHLTEKHNHDSTILTEQHQSELDRITKRKQREFENLEKKLEIEKQRLMDEHTSSLENLKHEIENFKLKVNGLNVEKETLSKRLEVVESDRKQIVQTQEQLRRENAVLALQILDLQKLQSEHEIRSNSIKIESEREKEKIIQDYTKKLHTLTAERDRLEKIKQEQQQSLLDTQELFSKKQSQMQELNEEYARNKKTFQLQKEEMVVRHKKEIDELVASHLNERDEILRQVNEKHNREKEDNIRLIRQYEREKVDLQRTSDEASQLHSVEKNRLTSQVRETEKSLQELTKEMEELVQEHQNTVRRVKEENSAKSQRDLQLVIGELENLKLEKEDLVSFHEKNLKQLQRKNEELLQRSREQFELEKSGLIDKYTLELNQLDQRYKKEIDDSMKRLKDNYDIEYNKMAEKNSQKETEIIRQMEMLKNHHSTEIDQFRKANEQIKEEFERAKRSHQQIVKQLEVEREKLLSKSTESIQQLNQEKQEICVRVKELEQKLLQERDGYVLLQKAKEELVKLSTKKDADNENEKNNLLKKLSDLEKQRALVVKQREEDEKGFSEKLGQLSSENESLKRMLHESLEKQTVATKSYKVNIDSLTKQLEEEKRSSQIALSELDKKLKEDSSRQILETQRRCTSEIENLKQKHIQSKEEHERQMRLLDMDGKRKAIETTERHNTILQTYINQNAKMSKELEMLNKTMVRLSHEKRDASDELEKMKNSLTELQKSFEEKLTIAVESERKKLTSVFNEKISELQQKETELHQKLAQVDKRISDQRDIQKREQTLKNDLDRKDHEQLLVTNAFYQMAFQLYNNDKSGEQTLSGKMPLSNLSQIQNIVGVPTPNPTLTSENHRTPTSTPYKSTKTPFRMSAPPRNPPSTAKKPLQPTNSSQPSTTPVQKKPRPGTTATSTAANVTQRQRMSLREQALAERQLSKNSDA